MAQNLSCIGAPDLDRILDLTRAEYRGTDPSFALLARDFSKHFLKPHKFLAATSATRNFTAQLLCMYKTASFCFIKLLCQSLTPTVREQLLSVSSPLVSVDASHAEYPCSGWERPLVQSWGISSRPCHTMRRVPDLLDPV